MNRYEQLKQVAAGAAAKAVGKAVLAAGLVLTPITACSGDNKPKLSGTVAAVESCDTSAPLPPPIADLYNAPYKEVEANARARIQNRLCRIALNATANLASNKHEDNMRVDSFYTDNNSRNRETVELHQNLLRLKEAGSWDSQHNSAIFNSTADGMPNLTELKAVSTTSNNADGVTSIYKGDEWTATTYAINVDNPTAPIAQHYPPLHGVVAVDKYEWSVMPDKLDYVAAQFHVTQ